MQLLQSDKDKILRHVNQLNGELKDYKKRELINNLEGEIKKWIEIRNEILFYERLVKDFNTTKLTQKQKQAFQEIVQDEYLQQFEIYAKKLNTPDINIGLVPKKGRTLRAKYILSDKHNISSVMSEGEQKAIAMVEFATDIKMRNDYSSVLFDDPVTSLDYKRSEKFANLIYELSLERQVIVFTHDIMFYYYLYNACVKDKNVENKFFKIDAFDNLNKGIVSESFSGKLENLKEVTGKIKNQYQLINSKKILGDELEEALKKVYSDIRTWCELVVEEGFFKSVIRRYEPNIRFTKVKDIKNDFVEDLKKVSDLFEKSCRWMAGHSQPIGTQYNKPTVKDFIEDYHFINEIFDSYK